jgi:hypothetical protein
LQFVVPDWCPIRCWAVIVREIVSGVAYHGAPRFDRRIDI